MAAGDVTPEDATERVSVETLPGGGFRIDDRIDRRNFTVGTDGTVAPERVSGDRFRYPTDVAVEFTANRIELVPIGTAFVHSTDYSAEVELFESESFQDSRVIVEISGPLKVYVEVTGPCTVEHTIDEVTVDLDRSTTVVVGARSMHNRPATTVTTTEDPVDVMAAVSTFGTELMTDSCKRSYDTLRGHPPVLEVGDELSIPPDLEQPDRAVHLEVPPDLRDVLPVAPLAYYLGAAVKPATSPSLVVDGSSYSLESADGFEATVERTLKRTFFLDCLVRTATKRDVMLYEREQLDPVLDIDIESLEGRPAGQRLVEYMRVPYETIREYLPEWKLTAHVQPTRTGIESIPFLANELAVVRVPDGPVAGDATSRETGKDDVTSSDAVSDDRAGDGGPTSESGDREVVRPPETDSVGQAWVGPGVPVGASKTIPRAYYNRLARERREDSEIEVAVVCNDDEMLEEGDTARAAYGSNRHLPFDVSFHDGLETDGLRLLFESDLDYVHYVGHVCEGGFQCADGTLDIGCVEEVGVDIAFLNACRSYEQGFKLIEQGAIASVVTFGEVLDEGALRIGTTMAGLLDQGFPLGRALSIARARSIVGSQYLVLGDGDADIAQAGSLIPWVTEVETLGDDEYRVQVTPYLTRSGGMGAQFHPAIGEDPSVYLVPKTLPPVTMTTDEILEYFDSWTFPLILDGEFTWSGDAVEAV